MARYRDPNTLRVADLQRPPERVVNAIVWLVAIPYFFGSAIFCGIMLTKWAFGQSFRPDPFLVVFCMLQGVMLAAVMWFVVRRSLALAARAA